jgi:hypothetical protein
MVLLLISNMNGATQVKSNQACCQSGGCRCCILEAITNEKVAEEPAEVRVIRLVVKAEGTSVARVPHR